VAKLQGLLDKLQGKDKEVEKKEDKKEEKEGPKGITLNSDCSISVDMLVSKENFWSFVFYSILAAQFVTILILYKFKK